MHTVWHTHFTVICPSLGRSAASCKISRRTVLTSGYPFQSLTHTTKPSQTSHQTMECTFLCRTHPRSAGSRLRTSRSADVVEQSDVATQPSQMFYIYASHGLHSVAVLFELSHLSVVLFSRFSPFRSVSSSSRGGAVWISFAFLLSLRKGKKESVRFPSTGRSGNPPSEQERFLVFGFWLNGWTWPWSSIFSRFRT